MANGIAIVTGCAAGLGYELTRQLIGKGWLVCGVDFNEAAMHKLNAEFDGEFDADHFHGFVGDITDEDFAQRSLAQISALGHVIC
jgi:NAD(P)-dependent dehydrogenase (short-subunit alcohol dehydrogenase family)